MANPNIRLYGPPGSAKVRDGLTAADASDWTPDDESTPSDVILDAYEWEDVALTPIFRGTFTGESVDVETLIGTRDPDDGSIKWLKNQTFSSMSHGSTERVLCDGNLIAFRVPSLTLGGADDVDLVVTSGLQRRRESQS